MKRKPFTEEQIISILNDREAGMKVVEADCITSTCGWRPKRLWDEQTGGTTSDRRRITHERNELSAPA